MERMVDIDEERLDGIVDGGGRGVFVRTENWGAVSSRRAWERVPVSHLGSGISMNFQIARTARDGARNPPAPIRTGRGTYARGPLLSRLGDRNTHGCIPVASCASTSPICSCVKFCAKVFGQARAAAQHRAMIRVRMMVTCNIPKICRL